MATPNAIPLNSVDYFKIETYQESFACILKDLPAEFRDGKVSVGIVCGSGLGSLAELLKGPKHEIPYEVIHGHAGKFLFGFLAGQATVCMMGRKHLYEGNSLEWLMEGHACAGTSFPIRIMKMLGVKTLVVTNAAGSLNPDYNVGDIMIMADHISFPGLSGQNPLIGRNLDEFGVRFPAMSDAYDFDLRVAAFKAAKETCLPESILREGVYVCVAGPSYETRAECRFLKTIGADVVGMSTVPEVVVARHCGIKVLGLSLVTNKVAISHGRRAKNLVYDSSNTKNGVNGVHCNGNGTNGVEINDENVIANHAEVLDASNKRANDMRALVYKFIEIISGNKV